MARAPPVPERSRTARRLIIVLVGLALALAAAFALYEQLRPVPGPPATVPPLPSPHALLVGVDDDTLKWTARPLAVVRRQQAVGAQAVRVWVPWYGEATPGAVRRVELARAEQAARRTRVVLAIFGFGAETPTTPAAQARFCGYAGAALALVPDARAVVVWDEANSRTYWRGGAEAYERLLARCYDELHALRPEVRVLDSTASAHAPGAFLLAVGRAYRASGRTAPLVDAFGHDPYPRTADEPPDARHASGFIGEGDYGRLAATLHRAFGGTAQRSFDVWYLEDGFQSLVPRAELAYYAGTETVTPLSAETQAQRLGEAILLAACQAGVKAFFNFELVDETRLAGWQSGLFWREADPKPAAGAFAAAASEARTGNVSCEA
jgi:hypothetical protein